MKGHDWYWVQRPHITPGQELGWRGDWICSKCGISCMRAEHKKPGRHEKAGTVDGMYTCEEMQVRQVMES